MASLWQSKPTIFEGSTWVGVLSLSAGIAKFAEGCPHSGLRSDSGSRDRHSLHGSSNLFLLV